MDARAVHMSDPKSLSHLQGRHVECIADCDVVTKADPLNAKAYLRKSKAYVQLGQLSEAIAALQAGIRVVQGPPPSYGATPPAFDAERADALTSLRDECSKVEAIHSLRDAGAAKLESGEFGDAARLLGEVLTHCDSSNIQLLAARAQLGVGVCDWATRVTLQILRTEPRNPTA
jgi:tetratricopeptide (TPR) repeat protein